jgi:hypothetical protein
VLVLSYLNIYFKKPLGGWLLKSPPFFMEKIMTIKVLQECVYDNTRYLPGQEIPKMKAPMLSYLVKNDVLEIIKPIPVKPLITPVNPTTKSKTKSKSSAKEAK